MLKIKDDVDLKLLKKKGFKLNKRNNYYEQLVACSNHKRKERCVDKADKMFEDLGYQCDVEVNPIFRDATTPKDNYVRQEFVRYDFYFKYTLAKEEETWITIWKSEYGIFFDKSHGRKNAAVPITTDELKAINEKVKELGGIDVD